MEWKEVKKDWSHAEAKAYIMNEYMRDIETADLTLEAFAGKFNWSIEKARKFCKRYRANFNIYVEDGIERVQIFCI